MDFEPLGPKSKAIIERINKLSAKNYHPYPFVVEKAEGAWLYDPDGNRALDMLSAYSAILSHRHPKVIQAVKDEMDNGSDLVSRAIYSSRYADFLEAVNRVTGYEQVLPKSDGGSSTDSAISGLLMHGHRQGKRHPEVILTKEYFHGRSFIFQSNALFDDEQSMGKIPQSPGIKVVDDTPEAVKGAINENTVGMFIETHKGEGGPLFSTKDHYMALRELATDNGIFLGCDEIQTGLGRCGHIMAWQEFGEKARPDFVTLGKALGGGVIPVSCIAGNESFMDIFTPGSDGSTFGGYPIACAAAVAALKAIEEEDIPGKAQEIGTHILKDLKEIPGVYAEGRGALIRVELPGVKSADLLTHEMLVGKDINPRVFMKHGSVNKEKDISYCRIAPPPGAMTKELFDDAFEKTILPVLSKAGKNI